MNARSAADRLEVWTYEEAGETIPSGDPSVTDAERSAAGLETMAARWQACCRATGAAPPRNTPQAGYQKARMSCECGGRVTLLR